jgi:hypothetical protein
MGPDSDTADSGTTPADREAAATRPAPVLVDAHAHLYDCYDRAAYFDATLANIRSARQQLGIPNAADDAMHTPACLLLAEPARIHAIQSLLDQGELDGGRWRFIPCGDGLSLTAQLEGRDELILIEGRQIKTREHLEVLSLCCDAPIPDGRSTAWALGRAIESGGLPVLPFGVGKWHGTRGQIIHDFLHGPLRGKFCLGDNAGRLASGRTPPQFIEAARLGVWVLPGSGTLPFSSQATRIGRFGLVLNGSVDRAAPAASIKRMILAGGEQPAIFGRPNGLVNFLKTQVVMQVVNQWRGPDWYMPGDH